MSDSPRTILLTAALPYANGSLHLGNMIEYIQADIWARFQKMRGHRCIFVCGDDTHGTPVMLSAQRRGISPELLIHQVYQERCEEFAKFYVEFDCYHTTHSDRNKRLCEEIYRRLRDRGDIVTRSVEQAYDPVEAVFLPDRYVKGTCPRCRAPDQYGDNCEVCGANYTPLELIDPCSALSGAKPQWRSSLHYFFCLEHYAQVLRDWMKEGHLQEQVVNKLLEWFDQGLQSWDISRDAPYFGFEIPDAPGKYFYVWMDAPIGYMAACEQYCQSNSSWQLDDFWGQDSSAELYHFIGKDIIYFHALFWPAVLKGAGFRLPSGVFAHGFLTINGKKMSKSRGNFVTARQYLDHLNPEWLRYYYAARLHSRLDDIDLNFPDFIQRVNSDLVGKVVNIASRCAGFITKYFDGLLASECENPSLLAEFSDLSETIAEAYEKREYHQAVREIMGLADRANQYIDAMKPWVLAKDPAELARVQRICTLGLNLFRVLMIYLRPILPKTASLTEAFLDIPPLSWDGVRSPLCATRIQPFRPLIQRVDEAALSAMLDMASGDSA